MHEQPGKIDFHLHSYASNVTGYYAANALAIPESYSDPRALHALLKKRGMTLVTLTDHNSIDGIKELLDLGKQDVFASAEMTTTFPKDGCHIHVTVANVTEAQFREIDRLRGNVFEMVAHLDQEIAAQADRPGGDEIAYFMTHPLMSRETVRMAAKARSAWTARERDRQGLRRGRRPERPRRQGLDLQADVRREQVSHPTAHLLVPIDAPAQLTVPPSMLLSMRTGPANGPRPRAAPLTAARATLHARITELEVAEVAELEVALARIARSRASRVWRAAAERRPAGEHLELGDRASSGRTAVADQRP